jgi:PKD repeat protein
MGNSFPNAVGIELLTIIGGTHPTTNFFFYDWKVSRAECVPAISEITIYNQKNIGFIHNGASVQPTLTGYTITFSAATSKGATSYSWDFGDGSTLGTGVSPQHTYTVNGIYTVTLTITGPCGTQTKTSTVVIQGISLEEQRAVDGMRIFPNPFSSTFAIDLGNMRAVEVTVRVMSASGVVVMQKTDKNSNGKIDITELSGYPKGVYLLEISNNSQTVVKKIVKQ